jgi:transmembrane protein 120
MLKELESKVDRVQEKGNEFKRRIKESREYLDECVADLKEAQKELKAIESPAELSKLDISTREKLSVLRARLDEVDSRVTPKTGSLFVRLMLGRVNVKQYSDKDRYMLKVEYQKFKDRTNYIFVLFVLVQLFVMREVTYTSVVAICHQVWLLYYYSTLALREHILRVNSSAIRIWWIVHHYLSMAMSIVLLLWNAPSFDRFLPQFLYLSLVQGAVQFLLNRYQLARLYKQTALGRATRMDVGIELELDVGRKPSWAPSVLFLLPFILSTQLFQLFTAFTLSNFARHQYAAEGAVEWQVLALALLFASVSIGNFVATFKTYYAKLGASHAYVER